MDLLKPSTVVGYQFVKEDQRFSSKEVFIQREYPGGRNDSKLGGITLGSIILHGYL
jgi:hypothetical protein